MHVVVFGTGGIGGSFGGLMARAGVDVTFIARGEHLRAIRDHGLRVEHAAGGFSIHPAKATDDPAAVGRADVILLCTKAWQLEAALDALGPMIGPGTMVIPLQNSAEASDIVLARLGPGHALGGVCYTHSYLLGPGIVHSGGENLIVFGEMDNKPSARSRDLETLINGVPGLRAQDSPEIQKRIWKKFAWITSASALGAVTRAPGDIWRSLPETRVLFRTLLSEAVAVAQAHGVRLSDAEFAEIDGFLDGRPDGFRTSMQRDMEARTRSELTQQIGYVVRAAQELGVPVPASTAVFAALLPSELRAQGALSYD